MTLLPTIPEATTPRLLWLAVLAGAGTLATGVFACATPFAAVAALAALTLSRREALLVVAVLWLGNQALGFGLLDYPQDGMTIAWGVALLVAGLAAVLAAAPCRTSLPTPLSQLIGACAAAFVANQLVLYAASFILGGADGFSAEIVAYIAGVNVLWAVGLVAGHAVLGGIARSKAAAA